MCSVHSDDADSYMTAYKEWQGRTTKPGNPQHQVYLADIKGSKKQLEEKRKEMLAMALTYEDWLEHAEERKKLMQAILRADLEQLHQLEHEVFRTRRAPRQISFAQWREKVDKKEAKMHHQRQRMRREAELPRQDGHDFKSSAAIAHEEWVRRKKEEALTSRSQPLHKQSCSSDGNVLPLPEDEKVAAWEEWMKQKHKQEVAQLDKRLNQERQLQLNARQKKSLTVTQC